MAANEIENLVDEMLKCLDVDAEQIRINLSRLNDMRGLVIKRDDTALSKLLESIHSESESYLEHETKRHEIRQKLAKALNCSLETVTLSMLETRLSETKRNQVREKRAHLKSLVQDFKKEYASTIILVSECARFNKMLMKSIFSRNKTDSVYYGANGSVRKYKEKSQSWLVNCDI